MNGKRELQKIIYYSNPETKKLIEGIIADESTITGQSGSKILENHVLNDMLPENQQAKQIVMAMYCEDITIGDAISWICDIYAGESAYDNGRPLIDYMADLTHDYGLRNGPDPEKNDRNITYYYRLIEMLSEHLKQLYEDANKSDDYYKILGRSRLLDEAKSIDLILDTDKKENRIYADSLNVIYLTLQSEWDRLKNWGYTYRILNAICHVSLWHANAIQRLRLVNILTEISKKWK